MKDLRGEMHKTLTTVLTGALLLSACGGSESTTDGEANESDIPFAGSNQWCCECDCCEETGSECVPVDIGRLPSPDMDCTYPNCMPVLCSNADCSDPPHDECEHYCWGLSRNPPSTVCTAVASHCCPGECEGP